MQSNRLIRSNIHVRSRLSSKVTIALHSPFHTFPFFFVFFFLFFVFPFDSFGSSSRTSRFKRVLSNSSQTSKSRGQGENLQRECVLRSSWGDDSSFSTTNRQTQGRVNILDWTPARRGAGRSQFQSDSSLISSFSLPRSPPPPFIFFTCLSRPIERDSKRRTNCPDFILHRIVGEAGFFFHLTERTRLALRLIDRLVSLVCCNWSTTRPPLKT